MRTMITKSSFILVFVLALGASVSVFAQDTHTDNHTITIDIPAVSLLDLESSGSKNISAAFIQPLPLEAGDRITAPVASNTLWLNYSSIQNVKTKRVDVKSSALIDGVDVNLVAGASGTGFGTKGAPTAGFKLSLTDQVLINDIGSAYTVSGPNNGHPLTYSFAALDANYGALRSGSHVITVTYTLLEN